MPRYVVVESTGGSLYGDTATLAREPGSATEAALALDRARGRAPRGFGMVRKGSPSATLDVYRVPDGSVRGPDRGAPPKAVEAFLASHGRYEHSLVGYNS